jgi:hypothetical protein
MERHDRHRLAPDDCARGTAARPDLRLLHLACMQMLSVVVLPALAATAQGIYGGVAVGTMSAVLTLPSGPLYGALGARAFWVMALLCAAALPIAFALRGISINALGSSSIPR